MIRLAVPVWNDQVSTVLDFADFLMIVNLDSDTFRESFRVDLSGALITERVTRLRELGIKVLLCGAISRPLEQMIMAAGIEIIPFLKGKIDDVLNAYLSGRLSEPRFRLPGCHGGRRTGRGAESGRCEGWQGRGRKKRGWNI